MFLATVPFSVADELCANARGVWLVATIRTINRISGKRELRKRPPEVLSGELHFVAQALGRGSHECLRHVDLVLCNISDN